MGADEEEEELVEEGAKANVRNAAAQANPVTAATTGSRIYFMFFEDFFRLG